MDSGEHNLAHYKLFQDYLELYEVTLTDYLNSLDVPIEEFYNDVREAKIDCTDPYLLTFIDCLLASADYDSFYKVMSREGKKCKLQKQSHANIHEKAEEKRLPIPPIRESKHGSDNSAKAVPIIADSKSEYK